MERYFSFDGSSTRSEYWAVNLIGGVLAGLIAIFSIALISVGITSSDILLGLGCTLLLGDIIAVGWLTIATAVRRCRDAGLNPWWAIVTCIPYIGSIVFIVLGCLKSDARA